MTNKLDSRADDNVVDDKVDRVDSETALAKITVLMSKYYEDIGRGYGELNVLEEELICDIEEVLDNTDIDTKKVIIEKLEFDRIKGVGSGRRSRQSRQPLNI